MQSAVPFEGGSPIAELLITEQGSRKSVIIKKGDYFDSGSIQFAFEPNNSSDSIVNIIEQNGKLYFKAPFITGQTTMTDQSVRLLNADSLHPFISRQLYNFKGAVVVLLNYNPHARVIALPNEGGYDNAGRDAMRIRITKGESRADALVWKSDDGFSGKEKISLGNTSVRVIYGPLLVKLPFALYLVDFHIERYPGSNSPSWYESRVILQDNERLVNEPRRIYMNHILKYRGYRVFQSSYDNDEKGTVLSVSHDQAGTLITYAGYLLMALGMIFSLLNRNSRFQQLIKENTLISNSKKAFLISVLMTILCTNGSGQQTRGNSVLPVDAKHSADFGKLLIQDVDGRIEPVNTLSSQLLRKLSRKDEYKGMNSDQVFLGMLIDPETWQHEPLIRSGNSKLQEILGSNENYFSFSSFFKGPSYILQSYVEQAYKKKPANRSKFDNEIIRTDERVNIAYLVFTKRLLRILPLPGDSLNKWYAPVFTKEQFISTDLIIADSLVSFYLYEAKARSYLRKLEESRNTTEGNKGVSKSVWGNCYPERKENQYGDYTK